MPTVTYNPRENLNLEDQVLDYIDDGHRVLSVSGPTKTGKTVLIKKLAPRALWLSGGEIRSIDHFLELIATELELATSRERSDLQETASDKTTSGKAGVSPFIEGQRQYSSSEKTGHGTKDTLAQSLRSIVKRELSKMSQLLVIDDFHYIPVSAQEEIVRYLKNIIFDGLRVIVISVPHRAYDVVRVEKEMTGRVRKLDVGFWEPGELEKIATDGFSALNIEDAETLRAKLVSECFSSPHLMQDFCLHLCRSNGIRTAPDKRHRLTPPPQGWREFFENMAADTSKASFDMLARGPRQRTDRMHRSLKDGTTVDIYGLVLAAIAHTGPKTSITYEQLRNSVREVSSNGTAPQAHEITRVLEKMSEIARDQIDGEPVVDYDDTMSTLHIADPFFAYYLRWGSPHRQFVPGNPTQN